jgi:hypothetical protein
MGGSGTLTPDKDVNSRWLALNNTLSERVHGALAKLGYRLEDLIIATQDTGQRASALEQEVYKTGCGKVLLLTHDLKSSTDHPGVISRAGFVVSVSHFEAVPPPSKRLSRAVKIVEEYDVEYEYILPPEAKQNASLSELAQSIAADLDKAHVLEK